MSRFKGMMLCAVLPPILVLALVFSLSAKAPEKASPSTLIAHTYAISIPEGTQLTMWSLCEDSQLSYELVLAIFVVEGISDYSTANIKAEIASLAAVRDYWVDQGYSNEGVFVLMLLSRQRGVAGCKLFMDNNDSADSDPYVQAVTEYKYFLEQGPRLLRSL